MFSAFKKGTQSGELSDFFGPTKGHYTPKGKILTNVSIFSDFAHIFQFLPYPRGLDIYAERFKVNKSSGGGWLILALLSLTTSDVVE